MPTMCLSAPLRPHRHRAVCRGAHAAGGRPNRCALVYSDRLEAHGTTVTQHPVIDYQLGSLRDDFDFGSIVMVKAPLLHLFAARHESAFTYAGWYELRLFLSRQGPSSTSTSIYTHNMRMT